MHDLEKAGDEHEITVTMLFEMLTRLDANASYPIAEPIFWQNSLWAHKLAATLCWAYYVKQKIMNEKNMYYDVIEDGRNISITQHNTHRDTL